MGNFNRDNKKVFIIIGGGILQLPFIDEVYNANLIPIVFDINPNAPAFKKYSDDEIMKAVISTRDEEGCLKKSIEIFQKYEIAGVSTVGTDFSKTVAKIANYFGLKGNSYEVALATTNKGIMRERLKQKGINQPEFEVVSNLGDLEKAIKSLNKKEYVIKPIDNMGARGVTLINKEINKEKLLKIYEDAKQYSSSGNIIIEEYIRSYELSLDAIVSDGKIFIYGVADRFILNPPNFVELGHLMPSILPEDLVNTASNLFENGIKALGIKHGAAKGDIRVRYELKDGKKIPVAYVGEIASRLSGGFMSAYTFPYSTGINLMRLMLKVAVGEKDIEVKPKWSYYSCELGLISKEEGILKSIEGSYDAMMTPYIKNVFIMKSKGDKITITNNNVTKLANVISQADTPHKAITASKDALRKIKVILN